MINLVIDSGNKMHKMLGLGTIQPYILDNTVLQSNIEPTLTFYQLN